MSDYLRQARERWADRMPGAHHAYMNDPTTHYQVQLMDAILATVDMAMEDEGVPEDARQRIIRTVVYGSPNPADAEVRIAQQKEAERQMARWQR